MPAVPIRKARSGADSFGHVWPEDGAVVDVDYEQAVVLLAIPDGGFSVAETPAEALTEPDPAQGELSEIDPALQDATDSTPAKRPGRRRAQP